MLPTAAWKGANYWAFKVAIVCTVKQVKIAYFKKFNKQNTLNERLHLNFYIFSKCV